MLHQPFYLANFIYVLNLVPIELKRFCEPTLGAITADEGKGSFHDCLKVLCNVNVIISNHKW